MTTAEVEDMFDEPQTCHPSSCNECWRKFATRKRCQTPGSDLWPERTERLNSAMSALAAAKYDRRMSLGKEKETAFA